MRPINDGGPAFPSGKSEKTGYENTLPYYEGMTLRDWFAGQALQGILSQPLDSDCAFNPGLRASSAFEYADAMLTARNNLP